MVRCTFFAHDLNLPTVLSRDIISATRHSFFPLWRQIFTRGKRKSGFYPPLPHVRSVRDVWIPPPSRTFRNRWITPDDGRSYILCRTYSRLTNKLFKNWSTKKLGQEKARNYRTIENSDRQSKRLENQTEKLFLWPYLGIVVVGTGYIFLSTVLKDKITSLVLKS